MKKFTKKELELIKELVEEQITEAIDWDEYQIIARKITNTSKKDIIKEFKELAIDDEWDKGELEKTLKKVEKSFR